MSMIHLVMTAVSVNRMSQVSRVINKKTHWELVLFFS